MDYPTICQANPFEGFIEKDKNCRKKTKYCRKKNWGKKQIVTKDGKNKQKICKTKLSPSYLNNLAKFGETSFGENSILQNYHLTKLHLVKCHLAKLQICPNFLKKIKNLE